MRREWDGTNPSGLPRPIAPNGDKLLPVPWTQATEDRRVPDVPPATKWGVLDDHRAMRAGDNSLCLVCGRYVSHGFVFVSRDTRPFRGDLMRREQLHGFAVDHAPLHRRCTALTVAHCTEIRKMLDSGAIRKVVYTA